MFKIKVSLAHPIKNVHLISNLNADKIKVKQMQQLPERKRQQVDYSFFAIMLKLKPRISELKET